MAVTYTAFTKDGPLTPRVLALGESNYAAKQMESDDRITHVVVERDFLFHGKEYTEVRTIVRKSAEPKEGEE